jgi:tight adherence protein C
VNNVYIYIIAIVSFAISILVVEFGRVYLRKQLSKSSLVSLIKKSRKINSRLSEDINRLSKTRWSKLFDSLSKLSLPAEGWQDSLIKLKFIRAGFRENNTILLFYGVKSILFIFFPLVVGLLTSIFSSSLDTFALFLFVFLLAMMGYFIPDIFLRLKTKQREEEMQNILPDLLDLLVICAESGMGIDAALTRVSKEIIRSSPVLAEELQLTMLEIRAGEVRASALKSMGLRVNLENMFNLISIFNQVDRLGTSLGESLRIQSEIMRNNRLQKAEELAAKIPVKMLFPLIFFMFPSIFIVIIGPAMIQMRGIFE